MSAKTTPSVIIQKRPSRRSLRVDLILVASGVLALLGALVAVPLVSAGSRGARFAEPEIKVRGSGAARRALPIISLQPVEEVRAAQPEKKRRPARKIRRRRERPREALAQERPVLTVEEKADSVEFIPDESYDPAQERREDPSEKREEGERDPDGG